MCTLFVVDDNEIDQHIIKLSLDKYSFFKQVIYYDKGVPPISYLKKHQDNAAGLPDVIILDLMMPEFDGWNFLDAFLLLYPSLQKKINVYIVTASISSIDAKRALSYHFVQEFISKPITVDDLIAISKEVSDQCA